MTTLPNTLETQVTVKLLPKFQGTEKKTSENQKRLYGRVYLLDWMESITMSIICPYLSFIGEFCGNIPNQNEYAVKRGPVAMGIPPCSQAPRGREPSLRSAH